MRLRMADEDRERYGGPEWLDTGDVAAWLDNLGYDELVSAEDQIRAGLPAEPGVDKNLLWVVDQLVSNTPESKAMPMIRVRLWLSLRASGVDVALDDFRPARQWGIRVMAADAVPPADGADSSPTSSPESDETTSTSTSASSTGASTPGPDASTE